MPADKSRSITQQRSFSATLIKPWWLIVLLLLLLMAIVLIWWQYDSEIKTIDRQQKEIELIPATSAHIN